MVHTTIHCSVTPDVGTLMNGRVDKPILEEINSVWNNNCPVLFGTDKDPFRDANMTFLRTVTNPYLQTYNYLSTADAALQPAPMFFPIETLRQPIPACMWIPIITEPTLRAAFDSSKIYGFGLDSRELPSEDVVGRLINNGRLTSEEINAIPAHETAWFTWNWKSQDPNYSFDELDVLDQSRNFVRDVYLASILKKNPIDPTDPRKYDTIDDPTMMV